MQEEYNAAVQDGHLDIDWNMDFPMPTEDNVSSACARPVRPMHPR